MFLGKNLVSLRRKIRIKYFALLQKLNFKSLFSVGEGFWMKMILDDFKIKVDILIQLYYNNTSNVNINLI